MHAKGQRDCLLFWNGNAALEDGEAVGVEGLVGGEEGLPGVGAEAGGAGDYVGNGEGRAVFLVEGGPG